MKVNKSLDAKLVEAYQSGNKEALASLVKRWHVTFCEKAFWIVKDADASKDIAQDTWQTIIAKMDILQNTSSFGSWAIRIVYNKSIDALNKRNREQINLKDYKYEQDEQSPIINNQIKKDALFKAIKTLPKHQMQVLNLFYLESYSLNQISELLNISVGTSKITIVYAREKLKLKIIDYEK